MYIGKVTTKGGKYEGRQFVIAKDENYDYKLDEDLAHAHYFPFRNQCQFVMEALLANHIGENRIASVEYRKVNA